MQIKKLDATPYLLEGEKVELKITATPSKSNLIQTILCYAFWLLVLASDCFMIGSISVLKESYAKDYVSFVLMPIIIISTILHVVPFVFWFLSIMQSKQKKENKWYALTNKRILIMSGNRPVNVTFINLDDITSFKQNKDSINIALGEDRITLSNISDPTPISEKLTSIFEFYDEVND